jgi:hypothetical protein
MDNRKRRKIDPLPRGGLSWQDAGDVQNLSPHHAAHAVLGLPLRGGCAWATNTWPLCRPLPGVLSLPSAGRGRDQTLAREARGNGDAPASQ